VFLRHIRRKFTEHSVQINVLIRMALRLQVSYFSSTQTFADGSVHPNINTQVTY